MQDLKYVFGPMKVPFLTLGPSLVALGVGSAVWTHGTVNLWYVFLALVGAVSAHASVHAFNEYFDFKSGLDSVTTKTPFSGGSGTLQERPDLAPQALATAIATAVLTSLIGLFFVTRWGWGLLPIGIVGLFEIVAYTPWFAHNAFLSLISPGLGLGTLVVIGTSFALTGTFTPTAATASFVPFFLVSELLILNQFPDVEADRTIGRKNLAILMGRRRSSFVFDLWLLLCYVSIVVGVALGYLPLTALLGLATLALAVPTVIGVYRYADDLEKLAPYLSMNVLINILTPALVAVGLLIG